MEDNRIEDSAIFKSYLRGLLRRLVQLKEVNQEGSPERVRALIDELIEDTQKGIEE